MSKAYDDGLEIRRSVLGAQCRAPDIRNKNRMN